MAYDHHTSSVATCRRLPTQFDLRSTQNISQKLFNINCVLSNHICKMNACEIYFILVILL